MSQAAYDELSRCIVQLLLKEPFFGHLLGSVTRSGRQNLVAVVPAPHWFGELALIDGGPRTHDTEAGHAVEERPVRLEVHDVSKRFGGIQLAFGAPDLREDMQRDRSVGREFQCLDTQIGGDIVGALTMGLHGTFDNRHHVLRRVWRRHGNRGHLATTDGP